MPRAVFDQGLQALRPGGFLSQYEPVTRDADYSGVHDFLSAESTKGVGSLNGKCGCPCCAPNKDPDGKRGRDFEPAVAAYDGEDAQSHALAPLSFGDSGAQNRFATLGNVFALDAGSNFDLALPASFAPLPVSDAVIVL